MGSKQVIKSHQVHGTPGRNAHTFINGFHSAFRNILVTSSLAIVLYGFSNTFKLNKSIDIIKIMSLVIFIISFLQGLNTAVGFYRYYKILEPQNNLPDEVDLQIWWNYLLITVFYLVILLIIIIIAFIRRGTNTNYIP